MLKKRKQELAGVKYPYAAIVIGCIAGLAGVGLAFAASPWFALIGIGISLAIIIGSLQSFNKRKKDLEERFKKALENGKQTLSAVLQEWREYWQGYDGHREQLSKLRARLDGISGTSVARLAPASTAQNEVVRAGYPEPREA